jgi:hypothetical protein
MNGRPDHQKGQHDDLIMGISMPIYVGESSFSKLERVTEHTKKMLDSWSVAHNETVANEVYFNPTLPNVNVKHDRYGRQVTEASKSDYVKYGWLFGGR